MSAPVRTSNEKEEEMSEQTSQQNKTLARRWFEDLFSRGDLDAANEILSADFVDHLTRGDERGLEELKYYVSVEDLAGSVDPRSSSLVGRRNVGLDAFPFGVGQIGQVAPFHVSERTPSSPPDPIFQTVSRSGVLRSSRAQGHERRAEARDSGPLLAAGERRWPL
jgi:hypothetical protein